MKNPSIGRCVAVAGAVLLLVASASDGAGRKAGKAASQAVAGDTWSYAGKTGPEKWSGLSADNEQCKEGQFQSPIDIPDAKTRKGDFPSILFNYKPSPLKVIDDGHTIQVNYAPGSSFTIDDKRYELLQFHFHKPSEEKIDGKGHEMGVHLVHRGPDGKPAYIAVLLDSGKENRVVKTLMNNLPKEKGKEVAVERATINAVDLLPNSKDYYRFDGSLTTPPCTGDVTWFVMKRPVSISADSVARFGRAYPMNARPVQPVNGRDIAATR